MKTSTRILLLSFCALVFSATCMGAPLTGTVKAKDGRPLAGISVYSFDDRGTIAPKLGRRFYAETDSSGCFKLLNHGRVVYFRHPGFQPLAKVIEYSAHVAGVVLEPEHDTWEIPICASSEKYQKNKHSYVEIKDLVILSLSLPHPPEVQIRRVRDVDYVLYIFAYGPKERSMALQGWFGLNAADESQSAKSLVQSLTYAERWAKLGDFTAVDTYGQTTDRKYWHYLNLGTSAIFYEDASKEAADIFDEMLGKMCYETRKQ